MSSNSFGALKQFSSCPLRHSHEGHPSYECMCSACKRRFARLLGLPKHCSVSLVMYSSLPSTDQRYSGLLQHSMSLKAKLGLPVVICSFHDKTETEPAMEADFAWHQVLLGTPGELEMRVSHLTPAAEEHWHNVQAWRQQQTPEASHPQQPPGGLCCWTLHTFGSSLNTRKCPFTCINPAESCFLCIEESSPTSQSQEGSAYFQGCVLSYSWPV